MRFDLFLGRLILPWDNPDFYDAKDIMNHLLNTSLLQGIGCFKPHTMRTASYPAGGNDLASCPDF